MACHILNDKTTCCFFLDGNLLKMYHSVDTGCWYTCVCVCVYYLHVKLTLAAGVNLAKLVCSLFRKRILMYAARPYILLYSRTLRGCPCPEHDKSVHSPLASAAVNPSCRKSSTEYTYIYICVCMHVYISRYNEFHPRFPQKCDRRCRRRRCRRSRTPFSKKHVSFSEKYVTPPKRVERKAATK